MNHLKLMELAHVKARIPEVLELRAINYQVEKERMQLPLHNLYHKIKASTQQPLRKLSVLAVAVFLLASCSPSPSSIASGLDGQYKKMRVREVTSTIGGKVEVSNTVTIRYVDSLYRPGDVIRLGNQLCMVDSIQAQ